MGDDGPRPDDTRRMRLLRWAALGAVEGLALSMVLGARTAAGIDLVHVAGVFATAGIVLGIGLFRRGAPLPASAGRVEPWLFIAVGVAVLALSAGGDHGAGPGWSTLLALAPYPVLLTALVRLLSGRVPGRVPDVLVQAGLISTLFCLALWALVAAGGQIRAAPAGGWWALWVVLPALDMVLLTITVRLLLIPGERLFVYRGLLLAVLYLLGSHVVGALGAAGGWDGAPQTAQALFAGSLGFWAMGALHPSSRRLFEPSTGEPASFSTTHLILIEMGMLTAPVVIGAQAQRPGLVPPVVAVAAMVVSGVLAAYAGSLLWQRSTIERQAQSDELTGLPNRTLFFDRLSRSLAHARRNDLSVVVMFVDLDRFKQINDSFGHAAGDVLLRSVAGRLQSCVRTEDTVARFGGDEFALLLPHVSGIDGAVRVAERVLASFTGPVALPNGEVVVTPSVGISVFPQDGADAEALIDGADAAMYRAKEQGRNTYEIFSPALRARAQERLAVETALHHALARGELVLHYQPKVDLATGAVTGAEALVRWQHPEKGLLYPGDFVPVAEQSGQIVALGEYVLAAAAEQQVAWQAEGLPPLTISVNVSARQLHGGLVDYVAAVLRHTGLVPQCLELELTESALLENIDSTVQELGELRKMGLGLSIDDFGTGYSGLSYLSRLPLHTLKIDKSFVDSIGGAGTPIVDAVIALGHSLQLTVIAEGVETHDQLAYLTRQGCDEIQGYLFSKPVPADAFEALVRSHRPGGPGRLPVPLRSVPAFDRGDHTNRSQIGSEGPGSEGPEREDGAAAPPRRSAL